MYLRTTVSMARGGRLLLKASSPPYLMFLPEDVNPDCRKRLWLVKTSHQCSPCFTAHHSWTCMCACSCTQLTPLSAAVTHASPFLSFTLLLWHPPVAYHYAVVCMSRHTFLGCAVADTGRGRYDIAGIIKPTKHPHRKTMAPPINPTRTTRDVLPLL